MKQWDLENMPSQEGRIAVVTGANSGLGYYTVKGLASKGAEVIMACRNTRKAESAMEGILRDVPKAKLKIMELDLSDLSSIQRFGKIYNSTYQRLDILINNAGLMAIPFRRTVDGFEMQFGVNHLGHFALSGLLFDMIKSTPASRIVIVSSAVQKFGKLRLDKLDSESRYRRWAAYSGSKFANMLFMLEMADRIRKRGYDLISAAVHPGYAATHILEKAPEMNGRSWIVKASKIANRIAAQDTEMGALPSLYAATAEDVINGGFYGPDGFLGMKGFPTVANPKHTRISSKQKEALWSYSEEKTGVSFLNA